MIKFGCDNFVGNKQFNNTFDSHSCPEECGVTTATVSKTFKKLKFDNHVQRQWFWAMSLSTPHKGSYTNFN